MANPIKIYKTLEEAYNALLKGFRSIQKREPNPIENQMIRAEAEGKIKSQGDNISILPQDKQEGIMSQASGTKKPDLDRPFVTEQEMSAFTLEDNARKLNKAKGFIDKLGAKTARQKLFVADLVEDAGEGIFKNVDMGAVVRSNMFDDLIEQGIDDDLLTKIMYSDTKSDNFATTLAKIKSNAMDEGADIGETLDFYDRVFDEVSRVKKAMGGRIGYAVGTLPKSIQKLVQALNKKFGKGTVKTADEVDQPPKTTQQQISEFEARNPDPKRQLTNDEIEFYEQELGDTETWMMDGTVGEAEEALKNQKAYMADMELEYKKGNLDPVAGDKSPARKRFLEQKLEEMEASGDKRLMTPDEIEELSSFDSGTQVFKDSEGGIKGITMGGDKEFKKAMSEAMEEGMRESENMKRLGLDPTKMNDALKYDEMKKAGQLEKNVTGSADLSPVEELKIEFPGITDEMIENILKDDNPQRIAEVKQTMREAMEMEKKGMNVDEIIDTFKNQKRTKQANGGLSYLMGM